MGGVQMMLVLGAMVLLSLLVLNINRTQMFSEQQMSQSEYTMAATAVGQSLVNEAAGKAFDAATATDEKAAVSTFTAPRSLGRGSWETYPDFNDFDDYHRFTTTRSTPRAGTFRLAGSVDYVNPATPNTASNVRTRMKRIRVTVTSDFMDQPVILVHYKSH
jgi:Flp pilus assembly protein TadG